MAVISTPFDGPHDRDRPNDRDRDESGPPDPRRVIASLPQALFLLAPDLSVTSVNPAGEQLVGQGASRLIGRSVHDLFAFEEAVILERLGEREAHLVARGSLVRILDQPARAIDLMTAPVLHFPGWQILVLQEPVGVEALTLGMAGGDEPGGGVLRAPEVLAHEIKNPLAGIRGAAQLLDRRVSEGDRALTGLITTEVDRIAKLIDQMQSLSRRSPEPAVDCNLHEASRHAHAILVAGRGGRDAKGEGPIIEEEFDPSLPPISANHDSLVQVLLNLMANARDACEGVESPRIIVRTRFASGIQVHSGPGGAPLRLPIELRVTDNGPGVPAPLRDHIFEPFVSSKKSGQGLGLALVQKLVREMNGRVTYDRDEARGLTHFRLHLPVAGSAPSRNSGTKRA
jgi:two-component system nitrogen regulation sensor histidine kinase GlnL